MSAAIPAHPKRAHCDDPPNFTGEEVRLVTPAHCARTSLQRAIHPGCAGFRLISRAMRASSIAASSKRARLDGSATVFPLITRAPSRRAPHGAHLRRPDRRPAHLERAPLRHQRRHLVGQHQVVVPLSTSGLHRGSMNSWRSGRLARSSRSPRAGSLAATRSTPRSATSLSHPAHR
jgi:hypothetical protein